jgi:hypothetical protein
MGTFMAKPLTIAPAAKSKPLVIIVGLRPYLRVAMDANMDETRAARYSDEVNNVNIWLSNLQY